MTTENTQNQDARQTADYRQEQFDGLGNQAGPYKTKVKFIGVDHTHNNTMPETNYMDITADELEAIQALLTKKVYEFGELPEDIQGKILEKFADINVDFEWWDSMYEDAKNVLLKLDSFDLDRNRNATGEFIEDAEDTANKIIAEHGETCETYTTATNYLAERAELVMKYSTGIQSDTVSEDFDSECEDIDAEFLRSILEDYSINLQKEYEYLTGEQAIIETIKANEYQFAEDGEQD